VAFEYWNGLTDTEKLAIATRAKEAQDRTGHHTCYWCGSPLAHRGYDYTSSVRDPREICKGHCQQRRFFDDPD